MLSKDNIHVQTGQTNRINTQIHFVNLELYNTKKKSKNTVLMLCIYQTINLKKIFRPADLLLLLLLPHIIEDVSANSDITKTSGVADLSGAGQTSFKYLT